jgi:hypothetical protein
MEVDGNGMGDKPYHVAISNSEDKLRDYCLKTYGKNVGRPTAAKFTWENYFVIEKTPIVIL